MTAHPAVWAISAVTLLLILVRPRNIPEAVWAGSGAALLIACRAIGPLDALSAIARGIDVYLFLIGMMILSELARRAGVFDWAAAMALQKARGSRSRLFLLIYATGAVVTIFLSNDATAVVLTPAVFAVVTRARVKPLPYLLICAFIANAASFVLPISNPANLVFFTSKAPPLAAWLREFSLPSIAAIAITFLILRLSCRRDLKGVMANIESHPALSVTGRRAAYGIAGTSIVLMAASFYNLDLGLPTFLAGLAVAALIAFADRQAPRAIIKHISWSVLPLVAGLFVLVEAVNQAGAANVVSSALAASSPLTAAFGAALLSNLANNLPVGLMAAGAVHATHISSEVRNALLIGVDLGPNLSITGSLATILWLVAIRREGEDVTFWQFLRYGALVMPPALLAAVYALEL